MRCFGGFLSEMHRYQMENFGQAIEEEQTVYFAFSKTKNYRRKTHTHTQAWYLPECPHTLRRGIKMGKDFSLLRCLTAQTGCLSCLSHQQDKTISWLWALWRQSTTTSSLFVFYAERLIICQSQSRGSSSCWFSIIPQHSFYPVQPVSLLLQRLADSVLLGRVKPGHKQKELQLSHVKPLDTVCAVSVSVCVCVRGRTHGILFSAESVLFSSMQLIVLRVCQPKAVKNNQPYQMRCNLFVSLQACKVEPCE